ncbi:hypothetical protein BS17DRAFT_768489 [Gyrodon lividus]|nr:hypothetical protein BS17DRAFT_768489 [Gyrodon lividus]
MADSVAEYIGLVRIAQLIRFCQSDHSAVVPCVVMVYDHYRMLAAIWRGGIWFSLFAGLAQRLYVSNMGLSQSFVECLVTIYSCKVFIYLQPWPPCVIVWLVQFILQMRLYALYNKSKKLVTFTGAIYIAEIIAMSGTLVTVNSMQPANQLFPGIYICTTVGATGALYGFWLAPLAFESILCSLAIWISVRRSREYIKPAHIKGSGMRLLDAVIMGNVLYFFGICKYDDAPSPRILVSFVASAAMWQALGSVWLEIPEGFPQASEIIAGCRLILHVRSAGSSTDNTIMTSASTQVNFQYPMQRLSHTPDEAYQDQ